MEDTKMRGRWQSTLAKHAATYLSDFRKTLNLAAISPLKLHGKLPGKKFQLKPLFLGHNVE
jgi:hypothetical protein